MTLKEGDVINGRYRLVSERGRGTFGEVWQAWDEILDMEVAIKVYIALDTRGISEFKSEFRTTFTLNHPNLLHASHFDVVEKRPYLVMPFCPESADELVGKITETEAWQFIKDVSSGLAYLHSKDIIHRDIKPDNILRDVQGDFLISDFGVSVKMRSTLRRNSVRDLSESATQGTIGYMGPEMFSSEAVAVKATDIWALGATVYELLEDELPFFGQGGVMQLHGGETPDLKGPWSDSLKSTVAACLSKETWERPKAEDLEWYASDILSGRSVLLPWEEAWKKKKEEDDKLRLEAERRRILEEQRAEEARRKALEEERKRKEEARKAAEEERKRVEAENRRKEEEARKAAEEERKRVEAEKRRKEEEARIAAEVERKRIEEEKRRQKEEKDRQREVVKAEKEADKGRSNRVWIWLTPLAVALTLIIWRPWSNTGASGDDETVVPPVIATPTPETVKDSVVVDVPATVTDQGESKVKDETINVQSVTIQPNGGSVRMGETIRLRAIINPSNSTNKAVSWTSGNINVATVSSNGTVTPKSVGSVTITVTTTDGGKTATCTVTVQENPQPSQEPKPATNDWNEIKKLADGGDVDACARYANHSYEIGQYDLAHRYATKAGKAKGTPTIVKLRKDGYYDEGVEDPGWK